MKGEKKERDYAHEYKNRIKKKKSLVIDIEASKAAEFRAILAARGQTLASWMHTQIDNEIKGEAK